MNIEVKDVFWAQKMGVAFLSRMVQVKREWRWNVFGR
jgi:hypothetical protein